MYLFNVSKVFTALVILLLVFLQPFLVRATDTIHLPADPPNKRTVALNEVWSIGADNDDVLLGLITSGVLDNNGNVLLVDTQLSHVVVISPDGEFVTTLGREGDGPGEMRNLSDIIISGDRVGMIQTFPGKVVYVDFEGVPAGGFTLGSEETGGHFAVRNLRCVDGTHVGHTSRSSIDFDGDKVLTRATLSVLDSAGVFGTELVSHESSSGISTIVLDEAAAWAEFSTWAFGPSGMVATVAERDLWAINERNLDGSIRRILRRPCTPRMRTDEEKEEAVSQLPVIVATGSSTFDKKALDTAPAIVDLQYASDGRLFVKTCHNGASQLDKGVVGRYDVISTGSEFLEELTLTFTDFDPQQDAMVFLDGTHFLILRNYEDAQKAVYAGLLPDEDKEDLSDAEPLEVVLVRVP